MKLKYLSRKAKKQYLQTTGQCPYCGYTDLSYGGIEMNGEELMQDVACPECLRGWMDCYVLTDLVELDPVCGICHKSLAEGEDVTFVRHKGYFHSECADKDSSSR